MTRRGPFVRWSDLPGGRLPVPAPPAPAPAEDAHWVRNDSGQDLPRGSVLRITGSVTDSDSDLYASHVILKGETPDADDDTPAVGLLPLPIAAGKAGLMHLHGVAHARLIGAAGKRYAAARSGHSAIVAADQGPFTILHDPGPEGEERLAIVRFDAIGDGEGTGTGSEGYCECGPAIRGVALEFPGVCCVGHARWRATGRLETYVFYALEPNIWTTAHNDPNLDNPLEHTCECPPTTTSPGTSAPSTSAGTTTSAVCVDRYDLVLTASTTLSTIELVPRDDALCGCAITARYERIGRFDCQGPMTFQLKRFCNSHLLNLPRCLCVRPYVSTASVECAARITIFDDDHYAVEDPPSIPAFSNDAFPTTIVLHGLSLDAGMLTHPAWTEAINTLNDMLADGVSLFLETDGGMSSPVPAGSYYRQLQDAETYPAMALTLIYSPCERTNPDSHVSITVSDGGQALGRLTVELDRVLDIPEGNSQWHFWRRLAIDGPDDLLQEATLTRHPTMHINECDALPSDDEVAVAFVPATIVMQGLDPTSEPTSDGYCDSTCDECDEPPPSTTEPTTTPPCDNSVAGYCCIGGVCAPGQCDNCLQGGGTFFHDASPDNCEAACGEPPPSTTEPPSTTIPPSTTVPPSTTTPPSTTVSPSTSSEPSTSAPGTTTPPGTSSLPTSAP